ncbi:MAG: formylglycine-generating enzyme family protein [Candidatus Eisenbacteria bacterium]
MRGLAKPQVVFIVALAVLSLLAVAVFVFLPREPEPLTPTNPLYGRWGRARTEVRNALALENVESARTHLAAFQAAVDSLEASGAATVSEIDEADLACRSMAEKVKRTADELHLQDALEVLNDLVAQGKYKQVRSLVAFYINQGSFSESQERQLSGVLKSVDRALRGRGDELVAQVRDHVRNGDIPAAFAVIDECRRLGIGPDAIARAEDEIPKEMPLLFGLDFVRIPGGSYEIGTPAGEHGRDAMTEHEVEKVGVEAFYISRTEVTQHAFRAVIPFEWEKHSGDNYPAHSITFSEATAYCDSITARDPFFKFSLPTESEWEIACRACLPPSNGPVGIEGPFKNRFDKSLDSARLAMQKFAWFMGHKRMDPGPSPVAELEKNDLGLYDMHGNLSEWCRCDPGHPKWYEDHLGEKPIRGGSFTSTYARCRAGSRAMEPRDSKKTSIGFRVICRPKTGRLISLSVCKEWFCLC